MTIPANRDWNQLILQAVALHQAGNLGEAATLYQEILNSMPEHGAINNNYGVLLMQCSRPQEALQYLARGVQYQPEPDHVGNYAHCLYSVGAWEALKEFSDSLTPDLRNASAPQVYKAYGVRPGRKVFCIGHNKTGTTSLEAALRGMGLEFGLQARGELLFRDWLCRDFRRIVQLAQTADAFQDIPFSLDYTFVALDQHFPGAKFILTVRDDAEQWYRSITRFHSKVVNGGKHLPTAEEMKNFDYRYRGYLWETCHGIYGIDEQNTYDRDRCIAYYQRHNQNITEYFKHRPDDLLVLNLSSPDAMAKLSAFLGIESSITEMPHLNRSN